MQNSMQNASFLRLPSWQAFSSVAIKGLKVFLFYLAVLSFCRAFFIFWMHDYMAAATGSADIALALWRGMRLSFQTAGGLALFSLVPAALARLLHAPLENLAWRVTSALSLTVLSILYAASFPYYRQYHTGFHQLIFNTVNEDVYALFISLVQEFYLPVRLAGALLLAFLLYRALCLLLACDFSALAERLLPWRSLRRALFLLILALVALLSAFGGSLRWQDAVNWENAGVTNDAFLNEAILDNFQALYRAYVLNSRFLACNGLDFTVEEIERLAALHAGRPADTRDLDVYLTREAEGAQIEKPRHIFLIISESYANWPLLEKYASLHIADPTKELLNAADTVYCDTFLPNGSSTVSAVTGVVTGFADANLYLTTMPESFAAPYPTAIAPTFARLGYHTDFWYAGPATWERIEPFCRAQGFEQFYSRGDFSSDEGSVWGVDDEVLYGEVLSRIDPEQPGLHVLLNVSNHSPYTVDLAAKGFPAEEVRAALPQEAQGDDALLKELGHYWYATQELAAFLRAAKEKFPEALFVIVGDHADRYNIEKTPSLYERYAIPFILTGHGVKKGLLDPEAAGSQIDIAPTLIELIAPRGFRYEAVGRSLTRGNRQGVNYGFWITHSAIGRTDTVPLVAEPIKDRPAALDEEAMQDYINAVRALSWWRPKYGPMLDEAKLEGRE